MKSDTSFDLSDLTSIPDYPARSATAKSLEPPPEPPSDRGPTRTEILRRRRIAMLIGAAWLVVLLLLLGVRHDFRLSLEVLAHAGLPALLGAAALYAALAPGRSGLGPNARMTFAFAVGGPIAFVVCALAFPAIEGSHQARAAFFCGDWGLLLGAVPLAALVWAQQRTCAAAAPWRSALLGVAMGLVGAATLGMHCANGDGWHVALGHGWPLLVFGVVGFGFVGRFTRVR
jgi:hypothetical protein